ncbi:helix-turn-helix domain-containing protein [Bradyrhizobium sp. S3.7.6]
MMMVMMAAAEGPRASRAPVPSPQSSLPKLPNDAARIAWIDREYHRQLTPSSNQAKLMLEIAAQAFHADLDELCAPSRKRVIVIKRQKIVCIVLLMTDAPVRKVAALLNRRHTTIIHAKQKYEVALTAALAKARACA